MYVVILGVSIIMVFVLAFLIDISVNVRRIGENIKKMVKNCESSSKS